MRTRWTRKLEFAALASCLAALVVCAPATAQPMVGLTKSNELFTFDSATPATTSLPMAISGLNAGDTLVAIDRNPNDGALYAVGSQSRMYKLNETTNPIEATQQGSVFGTLLTDAQVGLDFDPGSGFARITTDGEQNMLWAFGSVFAQPALAYAPGDPNVGENPSSMQVRGIAYTHNVPNGQGGTAYAYDYFSDDVVRIGSPGGSPNGADSGLLTSIGSSGITAVANIVGLDAGYDGTIFGVFRTTTPNLMTRLYTVDPATGAVTLVGPIGTGADTTYDVATDAVTNNFHFSAPTYNVGESAGSLTVTVTRSQSLGFANVNIATADASAVAGHDYKTSGGTLFFADGQMSRTLDIPIRSDAIDEAGETFTVTLSGGNGGHAATDAPSTTIVSIDDDDTGPPPSTTITALTTTNGLVTFDSANPGTVSSPLAITGLAGGETLAAIDRRPATGQLYAMSDQSRLYTVNEATGAATQVGSGQFSPSLAGSAWGFDFDPVNDQIRVVSTTNGQNLHLNPTTGAATGDSPLVFDAGGPHAGTQPQLAALAYTSDVPFATAATAFGYDYVKDEVVRVGSPDGSPNAASSGATAVIGSSGISAFGSQNVGMDVDRDGRAWMLATDGGLTRINLVDLTTGKLTTTGDVGNGGTPYRDIATPAVSNVVQLGNASSEGSEDGGSATVTVTRDQTVGGATVDYATSDGTATAGSDYTATSGTLAFAAGEATKDITIPITDDDAVEDPESLTFTISHAAGGVASLGSPTTATVTITSEDVETTNPPPPPTTTDTTPPVASTCHKSKQRLTKKKPVIVCVKSNENGHASATGKLKVRGVKKPFKLKKASDALLDGIKLELKLKLSKKARRALRRHRRGTAKVAIAVTDVAGNLTKLTSKIKVRP